MTRTSGAFAALCLLIGSTSTFAADLVVKSPPPPRPMGGFFIGLGGSYNSVKFDQNLYAAGVSDIFTNGVLVAFGQAGGPATPFHVTQSTFAPEAQIGFFRSFADNTWLWGFKFNYKYLGVTTNDRKIDSPQSGSFTNTGNAPPNTTFTGNVIIESSQTSIEHQLTLLAFLGRSFGNSNVYLGVGPAAFATKTNIYDAIGFADINGVHVDITGTPANYSSTKWMWGGAAQIGMNYYFDPTWFLDMNYTYAMTGRATTNYSGPFSSTSNGSTDTGTLYVSPTQRITSQSFAVSLNKLF